jgi:branched-chain amino acid aminotransferase
VEKTLLIDELVQGIKDGSITEAFACGTAAIITPIEKFVEENGVTHDLPQLENSVSMNLRKELLDIQEGRKKGPEGWSQIVN